MNKQSNQVPWIFKNRMEWERWISLGRGNRLVIDRLGEELEEEDQTRREGEEYREG